MANMFVQMCLFFIACAALEISARSVPAYDYDGVRDEMVCQPRTKFVMDCNTCYCSLDGTRYSCTYMACPPSMQHLFENNDIPTSAIRKRSINVFKNEISQDNNLRKKREVAGYEGADDEYFLNDELIPESVRIQLARQQQYQDQQQFVDRQRHAYYQNKEQEQLKKQAEEIKNQLEYQKSLDNLQRTYDEDQDDIDAQTHSKSYPQKYFEEEDDDFEKQLALDLQKSSVF